MSETCAVCAEEVPERAHACPRCGAPAPPPAASAVAVAEEEPTIVSSVSEEEPSEQTAPAASGRCEVCGAAVAAGAMRCAGCAPAVPPAPPAERGGFDARPAMERFEALSPGSKELASQLGERLRTPAVATALIGGALAAVAVFAIGVALGIACSDESTLGLVGQGKGVVGAGFAQMLNFLQVGYDHGVGKLGPALFLVFPVGACALAALTQARRTRGLPPATRLASGAGIGVVFGLLMLVPALAAGTLGSGEGSASVGVLGAMLLGALWGTIGGLLGTYRVVRADLGPVAFRGLPPQAAPIAHAAVVALRPLVLALGLMAIVGTLAWSIETLRKPALRAGVPTVTAVTDTAAYVVEHGVQWTELGGLAQFRTNGVTGPVPVGDVARISTSGGGTFRVFGLAKAMPAYTFALVLLWTAGVMLLLALSAGFGVARLRDAATPAQGAAWGAIVGPTWAVAMVLVNAVAETELLGRAVSGSVFGTFLVGGALVGAAGGLLGARPQRATEAPAP